MKEFFRKLVGAVWNRNVGTNLIANGIFLLVFTVSGVIAGIWLAGIDAAREWSLRQTAIPNWLLATSGVVVMLCIAIVFIILMQRLKAKEPEPLYKSKILLGIRWRWIDDDDGPYDLRTHCPTCDLQIYMVNIGDYRRERRAELFCEECNRVVQQFDRSAEEIEDRVIRTIERDGRRGK